MRGGDKEGTVRQRGLLRLLLDIGARADIFQWAEPVLGAQGQSSLAGYGPATRSLLVGGCGSGTQVPQHEP